MIEKWKEQIKAKAKKIKRYKGRCNQFHQNRLFLNNQKRLFKQLEGKERAEAIIPDANESKRLWEGN